MLFGDSDFFGFTSQCWLFHRSVYLGEIRPFEYILSKWKKLPFILEGQPITITYVLFSPTCGRKIIPAAEKKMVIVSNYKMGGKGGKDRNFHIYTSL